MKKLGFGFWLMVTGLFLLIASFLIDALVRPARADTVPKMNVSETALWIPHETKSGARFVYSCDNFTKDNGGADASLIDSALACVALSCEGIAIMSSFGYNETITFRRRDARGERAFNPTFALYSPKFSTWFTQQTRSVEWSSYQNVIEAQENGMPNYIRFSLPRAPLAATETDVYHFIIPATVQANFRQCATDGRRRAQ